MVPDAGGILDGITATEAGAGGIIMTLLGFLAQQYFQNRKENREDRAADRSSESGIVETTKATLAAVREQVEQLREDRQADRDSFRQEKAELEQRMDELEAENRELRRRLEQVENGTGPQQAYQPPRDAGYAYGSPSWNPGPRYGGPRPPGGEYRPGRRRAREGD